MKPAFLLGFAAVCLALTPTAYAGRYGSETRVMIEGSFRTEKPDETVELSRGGVRVTRAYAQQEISNATILAALKKQGLIEGTDGVSIVMVAPGHMADGIKFFAVRAGAAPVAIPTELLSLDVTDGPGKGVMQENGSGRLTKLDMETVNFATLKLKNFEGTGVLEQSWSVESVTKGDTTEAVELVKGTGFFSGKVSGKKDGVGLIALRLSKPKTTGLKRYGMVTSSTGTTGGSFGVWAESTVIDFSLINISPVGGTLTLSPQVFELIDGSSLTVNSQLVAPGLTVAFDGATLPIYTFGSNPANELTLNTTDGPVVYTREAADIWTIVDPEPIELTPGEGEPTE